MKKSISILLAMLMLLSTFAGLNLTVFAGTETPENGWYQDGDGYWYYFENGEYVSDDWRQIKGKWYYFGGDGEMYCNDHYHFYDKDDNETVYVFDKNGAMMANGWGKLIHTYTYGENDEYTETYTEWYYLNKNGSAVLDQWKKIGGKWYHFDDCGMMACAETRWIAKDGKTAWSEERDSAKLYAFDKNGAWISTWGWTSVDYTYFDWDQQKAVSKTDWYYVLKDGTVKTGWMHFHNDWFYLNPYYGEMYADGIYRIGLKYKDDSMILGSSYYPYYNPDNIEDFGKLYAFDKNGKMLSNQWYKGHEYSGYGPIVRDVEYAVTPSSSIETEDQWYYLGSDGAAITGWKQIKGTWYYFEVRANASTMAVGPTLVVKDPFANYSEGDPYFFLDSGAMASNRWIKYNMKVSSTPVEVLADTRYIDEMPDYVWFYATKSGLMATGWQKINGSWYYFGTKDDGYMYCAMMTEWLYLEDGTYYLDPATGKMVTGTVEIDGDEYEFDQNGRLVEFVSAVVR